MKKTFSARYRAQYLRDLQQETVDLLVIGGGITGAGIALDAQSRGMQVGLVEMQDFGSGTSSRSTKLVHGGLRYLKQLELKLVAEVGRERAIVYENGPHVTQPVPMLLPIVKGGSLGKWEAALALWVYDWLAGVKPAERRRILNAAEAAAQEPLLDRQGLLGGILYYEYRTDDARLTLEVLKEAVQRGAIALNYTSVTSFQYENNQVSGVVLEDVLTGNSLRVAARQIVNAAGPWVDTIDTLNDPGKGQKLFLTKGVHLVVDDRKMPLRQAVYFDAPGKRMVFAIPRNGKAYIGTTDTPYEGSLSQPRLTAEDRDYLLKATNIMFPGIKLQQDDVESYWAGLRPLIRQPGKGPGEISRRDELFQYSSGLVSIAGGKLTGYRKMAQRVVDLVASRLASDGSRQFKPCTTATIRLSGGDVGGSAGYPAFISQKVQQGIALGFSPVEAEKLVRFYGSNIDRVYAYADGALADGAETGLPLSLLAQLRYGLEKEMVVSPADFFVRRTGALYFDLDWVRMWEVPVCDYLKQYFNWSPQQAQTYRHELRQLIEEHGGRLAAPVVG